MPTVVLSYVIEIINYSLNCPFRNQEVIPFIPETVLRIAIVQQQAKEPGHLCVSSVSNPIGVLGIAPNTKGNQTRLANSSLAHRRKKVRFFEREPVANPQS